MTFTIVMLPLELVQIVVESPYVTRRYNGHIRCPITITYLADDVVSRDTMAGGSPIPFPVVSWVI